MCKKNVNKTSNNPFYNDVIKTIDIYSFALINEYVFTKEEIEFFKNFFDANWNINERDIIDRLINIQLDYFSVLSFDGDDSSLPIKSKELLYQIDLIREEVESKYK
ncbi:hypothetical protein [Peribacillus kribbensis]|uniref:hypothetical protein n=1 Tax=Peribacillus kribbensis TaxID=356658 RepID=UPI0003FAED59|nr:hypothetical protein [Peribacillus kribbensis]